MCLTSFLLLEEEEASLALLYLTLRYFVLRSSYVCGCDDGQRQYMGATSDGHRAVLAWLPRITGLLSLVGSSMILFDVYRSRKRSGATIYQGLVAGLSVCDIFSSLVWIVSTAAVQETFNYSYGSFDSSV